MCYNMRRQTKTGETTMELNRESVEDWRKRHPSIKTFNVTAEYCNKTPNNYIATIYWADDAEKPETFVMSYNAVIEYAKKHSKAWDAGRACLAGPWESHFDLMASKLVARKLINLCLPKILELDIRHDGLYLLRSQSDILLKLAEAGMREDDTEPYTYFIPSTLFFDVGRGNDKQLRAPYAILAMAKASYTEARFADVDGEGCPAEDVEKGMVRVTVYDPFAQRIEESVRNWQTSEIVKGNACIVNGRFYKVA